MKLINFVKFSLVIATVFFCLSFGMRRVEAETYAVVVGIKDYIRIGNLNFTKSDAYNFRDALIRIGVRRENIHLLTCPAKPGEPVVESKDLAIKDNIEGVIADVLGKAKEGDTVIIFLGGHGLQLNGQPYFEPINSRGGSVNLDPASMVSIGKIFTDLGLCKATHKLMIVDACRNDAKTNGVEPLKPLSLTTEGITLFQGSGSGESCLEIGWEENGQKHGYGIFTNALIEGMRKARQDASGNIRLYSWAAYVTEKTKQDAAKLRDKDTNQPCKQTPHLQGNMTDFVIVPRGKVDPPPQDEIEKAKVRVKKTVGGMTNTVLAKIAQDNKNPDLNPFNDSRLAQAVEKIIVEALEYDDDLWIASYSLSDDGLYVLTTELIADPVKDAIAAARKKWNEEKVKQGEAAIAAAAAEEKAKQEAIVAEERMKQETIEAFKTSLNGITRLSKPDDLFAFCKDKNVTARKTDTGAYEFGVGLGNAEELWVGIGVLGAEIYSKLNSVGLYLELGISPARYNKALDILKATDMMAGKHYADILFGNRDDKTKMGALLDVHRVIDNNRDVVEIGGAVGSFDVNKINDKDFIDIITVMKLKHDQMTYDVPSNKEYLESITRTNDYEKIGIYNKGYNNIYKGVWGKLRNNLDPKLRALLR